MKRAFGQASGSRPAGRRGKTSMIDAVSLPVKGKEWSAASEMLKHRVLYLFDEVNPDMAVNTLASIHYLEREDSKKPIFLIISTPGGYTTDGFAIVDAVTHCSAPVYGFVYGQASSMGSLILAACEGRFAAPNAEIMIHEPWNEPDALNTAGAHRHARDMRRLTARAAKVYVENTGIAPEEIPGLIEYDNSLSAREAKSIGLVDEVLTQDRFFEIVHGTKVPSYKRRRYPVPEGTDFSKYFDAAATDRRFEDALKSAARSRHRRPANDFAEVAPSGLMANPKRKKACKKKTKAPARKKAAKKKAPAKKTRKRGGPK